MPARSWFAGANLVFPQSHLHSHTTFLFCRSLVGRTAISFPKRCPAISTPLFPRFAHPQDRVLPLCRYCIATNAVFPQSHLHSHTTRSFHRSLVGRTAISFPKRWPVRSTPPAHPQDLTWPACSWFAAAKLVLPQSHLHSHTTLLFFRSSVGRTATSFPKRRPMRLLIIGINLPPTC